MPKPRFVGYDSKFKRQIWLLALDALTVPFECDELQKQQFACLCVIDASPIETDGLSAFCSRLIDLGCAYFCTWGPDCERVHDIMDEQAIGENPPATDIGCLMTTWHAKESLAKAVNYFLTCTVPDEEYAPAGCGYGLAVVVGPTDWVTNIERHLRQSTVAA
jgi:hypothetical protein